MKIERVGYRRLYDAGGCSIVGSSEVRFDIRLNRTTTCTVLVGPKPAFGVYVLSSAKYLLPAQAVKQTISHLDAGKASPESKLYSEIQVFIDVEVDDLVSEKFHKGDAGAQAALLKLAHDRSADLIQITEFVAGTIGLRFHRQFILEAVNENYIAQRTTNPVTDITGDSIEVLEDIKLNENGVRILPIAINQCIAEAGDKLPGQSEILGWLLRAWPERNMILKFLALFTALECALGGISVPWSKEEVDTVALLQDLIAKHGAENSKSLGSFLNKILERRRPTLDARFRKLATDAGWPSAEDDVSAFIAFNKIRNALIHRGDDDIKLQVTVGDNQVASLEDLAERYVCFVLYGDMQVYKSRWRPMRAQKNNDRTPSA